jgi:hypothetical protein
MACVHLNQLYQLCRDSNVKLSSTDLIHIVCKQCEREEVCPSVLFEEYEKNPTHSQELDVADKSSVATDSPKA